MYYDGLSVWRHATPSGLIQSVLSSFCRFLSFLLCCKKVADWAYPYPWWWQAAIIIQHTTLNVFNACVLESFRALDMTGRIRRKPTLPRTASIVMMWKVECHVKSLGNYHDVWEANSKICRRNGYLPVVLARDCSLKSDVWCKENVDILPYESIGRIEDSALAFRWVKKKRSGV